MSRLSTTVKYFNCCFALTCFAFSSSAAMFCLNASAAGFCVNSGDTLGLQMALATAASNGEDNLIKLQVGDYQMGTSFLLDYEAQAGYQELAIEGGYWPDLGDPCGLAPVTPAPMSALDGGLLRVRIKGGSTGKIALKALNIINMVGTDPNHAPIEILGGADATSSVTIDNVKFLGNVSTDTAAISIFSDQGVLQIHNSVFASNGSFGGVSPIQLGSLQKGSTECAEIIGSTFVQNTSTAEGAGLYTQCLTIVANDIFWGSVHGDLYIPFPQFGQLENDDLADLSEVANTDSSNLLSADPMIDSDYSLRDFSPLRNLGNSGGAFFAVGQYDVIGNPRTYGAKPDIGAFEIQDVIFAHAFDFQPPF